MYDVVPVICWYLSQAWRDVRSDARDLLDTFDLLISSARG